MTNVLVLSFTSGLQNRDCKW